MTFLSTIVELPVGWLLASMGALCSTVAGLAATIYRTLKSRLDAQDKVLVLQDSHIDALKAEVLRLSQGCGAEACRWRSMTHVQPSCLLPGNTPR
jgi:hypothetical protein